MTSLCNRQTYPHRLFRDLYHRRWAIEENYKTFKCRVEIENFTGKSVEAVYQDFHAKVVTANLTAVFAHAAQREVDARSGHRRRSCRVNFTQALSRMKDAVVVFLTRRRRLSLVLQLLDLLCRTLEAVRPDRRYPRYFDEQKIQGFYPTYKRTR